jgi:hypothetical protein
VDIFTANLHSLVVPFHSVVAVPKLSVSSSARDGSISQDLQERYLGCQ